jgi:UDP-3-O-[3-hydroxymyristoyl] N-acetylglucosamine deacetylase
MIDFFSGTEGYRVQKTLRKPCVFKGHGIHSGLPSTIQLIPCEPNTGTIFLKNEGKQSFKIPAHFDYVTSTSLATSLGLKGMPESRVSTVEHLLAALFALGINNVLVEVQGPEIPILDGSALPFIEGILDAGIELQDYSSKILRILKPIKVYEHGAICELLPRKQLRLTTSIDFNHPQIGAQTFAMDVTPRSFADQIGCARTFGFLSDLDRLKSKNLALGASLDNVLGFSEEGILNPEGMRFSDECVRHKWLDALGDLALCGSWVEGELVSFRGGHAIHLALLKALNNHKTHWELSKPESLTQNKVISLRK